MQNILITGSKGQLGTDCLDVFREIPHLVGVDLPEVDLCDRMQCFELLDRVRPEVIVNCAAYTAVDACETDPSCWKANAELPGHLAEWTDANNAFLAHVSTDYVFSGDKPLFQPVLEIDVPDPISEYGKSKLAGEQLITEQTDRYAILRTAWLYGAHGKNFLKTMLRLTLQNPGREFKVVNDQYGSPTWSHTLARQLSKVVDEQASGLFHASSEGYCTWYDLACAFLDGLNIPHNFVPCSTDEFPTPTKRPANSILENTHLKNRGINVFQDWKTDLRTYIDRHGAAILTELKAS